MNATDIGNLCLEQPVYLSGQSAWAELIPIAFTLIEKLRPRILVELGTHYGDSYCAFCQAIDKAEIACKAYAVDTWEGDTHAGFYGQDVLNLLSSQHDPKYSSFSRLLRETFDDASKHFSAKSIDLLHIDGLHTYEAVKHDFDTWLPLLSDRAIVIFHDINVKERDFGVWKLFDEISERYPTFRFEHSHGLGIAAIGEKIPDDIRFLFTLSDIDSVRIRKFYSSLGIKMSTERRLSDALHVQNSAVKQAQLEVESVKKELELSQHSHTARLALLEDTRSASQVQNSIVHELQEKVVQLEHDLQLSKSEVHGILNSRTWRTAAVFHKRIRQARRVRTMARKLLIAKDRLGGWKNFYSRVKDVLKTGGIKSLKTAARLHLGDTTPVPLTPSSIFQERARLQYAEISQRFTERGMAQVDFGIKISLLMPVYKVSEHLLSEAIESVLRQSYTNWELCIADDCSQSSALTALLQKHAAQDQRIKFVTLEENSGIAGATNSALSLATGEYIALLDNDDVLTNDALYSIAEIARKFPGLDWAYSDECKIDESGNVLEIFCKPDWSPSLLLNCMYSGHLSAYRKTLVLEAGGFRSEFDFSQDYDLALRVAEKTNQIYHIEKVLYGWRAIESSGAAGGKPYARDSNVRALQAAADRRGWKGEAQALPMANRFKFDIDTTAKKVSLVIPSDNVQNIIDSIESVRTLTSWSNYEILVVTNSSIVDSLYDRYLESVVKFVRYDQPYSFSDKCNKGANASTGEFLIFFNDDVRVQSAGWIESIIEFLQLPDVGIVGPKLVYESNTIQHAGMVTGVRRLLGTAFHCLPENTGAHYNFAQSVREVSLICGACLGIRKDVFEKIGGFDIVNTPINHSDVDLCFKVRELGYSCIYTPHSTLTHIGHMSLATVDAAEKVSKPKKKDKADIYILRRWASYLARDPFFTKTMREQLFHDSPEEFEIFAPTITLPDGGKDILIFSHDLTESGAPRVVYEIAKLMTKAAHFVVVASPTDGPIRGALQELGVPVIVDELLLTQHPSVFDLARNFDEIICNTVVTYPAVIQLADTVNTYWYIHETSLFTDYAANRPDFVSALSKAKQLWAGSKLAATPIRAYNPGIQVLEYGLPGLESDTRETPATKANEKLIIRTFGSYEPRKGQDLMVLAVKHLPESLRAQCQFEFYGRILDQSFFEGVNTLAEHIPQVNIHGDVDYNSYVKLILSSDMVVVPSRDDTLPLVSLHTLSAGKPLMCTLTTGTSAYINHLQSGFVFSSNDPLDMSHTLGEVIATAMQWNEIGDSGKAVFDLYFSEIKFSEKLLSHLNLN